MSDTERNRLQEVHENGSLSFKRWEATRQLMVGDFPTQNRHTGICRGCPPSGSTPVRVVWGHAKRLQTTSPIYLIPTGNVP